MPRHIDIWFTKKIVLAWSKSKIFSSVCFLQTHIFWEQNMILQWNTSHVGIIFGSDRFWEIKTRGLPKFFFKIFSQPPLCWKSNNPRVQAPWRNYLPYESMAKSKCFWQNRSDLTLWPFLQINPEKMTSLQMCRIKKIMPRAGQTFWDRQLCFYVEKIFVSEKTKKNELFHFS